MPRYYCNIIDYARTQLDTFEQRDVCRVDSLVLSWLAYMRIPEEVPEPAKRSAVAARNDNIVFKSLETVVKGQ